LTSFALDLLADIFRRAADHQAGDEDRQDNEQQHAVHAGADAADDDLAELDVDERDHAAERSERVVHRIDGAARRGRGDDGEQGGRRDAETRLFAFHVAAGEAEGIERRGTGGFRPIGHNDAGKEQHAHHGEDCPTLALVAHCASEHIGERRPDHEDGDHLHEVRQRRRILERMCRIGIEKAAAIGAEHLDGDLRGDRTDRDHLLAALDRGGLHIGAERLRDALPHQEQRIDDADRQQDVERAAGDIDPEIADGLTEARAKPRISAIASTMPVAAERKFWWVRPSICTR